MPNTISYHTKRQYTQHKKNNKIKNYFLIAFTFLAVGVIIGNRIYTEKVLESYIQIPEVKAAEQLSVKDYAWTEAKKHGLDPVNFILVIWGESRFNPEALGVNNNKTVDIGLLQINSIHKDISLSERLDPYKSIDWAIKKRLHDGNYSAWVAAKALGIKK